MKKLFLLLCAGSFLTSAAQLAVNTTNTPPDPSAMLDVTSTSKGVLIPRMTTDQRKGIKNAAPGLLVYDTDTKTFWYKPGLRWAELSGFQDVLWEQKGIVTYNRNETHIGIGTTNPEPSAMLHVYTGVSSTNGFLITGSAPNTGKPSLMPDLGSGNRLMYYPGKNAFRVGYAQEEDWNDKNVGYGSVAMGNHVIAKGSPSMALGHNCIADDFGAMALGEDCTAANEHSVAIGNRSKATGGAFAFGRDVSAAGLLGFAFGDHCLGLGGTAIGGRSLATGPGSMAIGYSDTASGSGSVTLGTGTKANGSYATAIGLGSVAKGYASTVVGMYNDSLLAASQLEPTSAYPLFIVGNGKSGKRSNALVIRADGNAELQGTIKQLSDARLKKNIQPLHAAMDQLLLIRGYTYYWKDPQRDSSLQTGVLAQEVQKVFPELVKEDERGLLSVNYSGLLPYVIEAAKEQQQQIKKLQSENEALKARLEKIERRLNL